MRKQFVLITCIVTLVGMTWAISRINGDGRVLICHSEEHGIEVYGSGKRGEYRIVYYGAPSNLISLKQSERNRRQFDVDILLAACIWSTNDLECACFAPSLANLLPELQFGVIPYAEPKEISSRIHGCPQSALLTGRLWMRIDADGHISDTLNSQRIDEVLSWIESHEAVPVEK